MKSHILAAVLTLALSSGTVVSACAWHPPVNIGDARAADLVFEGALTDMTRYSFADRPSEVAYATATFTVLSVLKGDPGPEVTVVIALNMMGAGVDIDHLPGRAFVATVSGPQEGWLQPHDLPDLPVLMHPTCGTAFLIPATPGTRDDIQAVLAAP